MLCPNLLQAPSRVCDQSRAASRRGVPSDQAIDDRDIRRVAALRMDNCADTPA